MTHSENSSGSGAMKIQFLGASATVTGSRYLLTAGGARILIDCGLFQGYKPLRLRNWAPFPVEAGSIDAVVLTHAHLDHSGYLPRLMRLGFSGRIWCTHATASLCGILLPDSGRLQEEHAEYSERVGASRHHPPEPLYGEKDARECLDLMQGVGFEEMFEPVPGVRVTLQRQGHILGAAAVIVEYQGRRIAFSGDIGRAEDPVMYAPSPLPQCDWIVTESTYGDRCHPRITIEQELQQALTPVLERGGVAIIPSFAVGRAQLLMHVITRLQIEKRLPQVPVYLNSPMASDVTSLYQQHAELHRLDARDLRAISEHTKIVNSVEESKALNRRKGPMIIISASGMLTGGRVLHHLIAFASDPRNAIVLCGYQAGGTRGAALAKGATQLRAYGQDVEIKAEVSQLSTASAHADADEILAWLQTSPQPPKRVFVTHGDPEASDQLRLRIKRELGWDAHTPDHLEEVDLR